MHQTPDPQGAKLQGAGATLGDVLYAGRPGRGLPEGDWIRLLQAVAAGDAPALERLYARTHRMVFTLLVRLTSNAQLAEDLMLDLYQDLWLGKPRHHPSGGPVLAWLMNETRARAIARLRAQQRKHRPDASRDAGLIPIDAPDYQDLLQAKEGTRQFQVALLVLAPEERSAIEGAFFSELLLAELAARMHQSETSVKALLRSGLHKLRHALGAEADKSLSARQLNQCDRAEWVCAHALRALAPTDVVEMEAHLASCRSCRREADALSPVVGCFHFWPTDVLRPTASVQERLARRIPAEGANRPGPRTVDEQRFSWEDVAPGISCSLLSVGGEGHMVGMLVRLVPGGDYPPHTHAGVEELHLLGGELWIDDRKLQPGDYQRAEPGTGDKRVWSETGCTCLLVTSIRDALG